MTSAHQLLTNPLLSIRSPNGSDQLSLPAVLAALARDQSIEFSALMPHQRHAWHAFLVQLGALVCHRRGADPTVLSESDWRAGLVDLAAGDDRAFALVVDDLSAPAFMQPPVPEGTLEVLKNEVPTPDFLDLLATAKNHDLKRRRIQSARPEHWIFALISLQTMEGFGGRDNYGISRMNGGSSNRPCISVASADDWSRRFVRDARVWLGSRDHLLSDRYSFAAAGHGLLWSLPWDGTDSLATSEIDPFYLECCRRVRLVQPDAKPIYALSGNSKTTRVDASGRQGDTGDAWTPIARDSGKSLTVPGDGFTYKRLQELLFSDNWRPAPAQILRDEDGNSPVLITRTLARGQSITEGFHERVIPIPSRVRGFFVTTEGRERLGKRSSQMIALAATARTKVLRNALLALVQGGPDRVDGKDARANPGCRALDDLIDQCFFESLFTSIGHEEDEAVDAWQATLFALCRKVFDASCRSLPLPTARRYRAIARAESRLFGSGKRHLPGAFTSEDKREETR